MKPPLIDDRITRAFYLRARRELAENFGLQCDIDLGTPFLNALFWGSLKSLADRVDPSGFCQTSFGEEGNIKCYGTSHYPRDAAEAAGVLASVGLTDLGLRILRFSLEHIPAGQYYLPHVYRRDGSSRANTVQVDTPGHLARALERCVRQGGPVPVAEPLYRQLREVCRAAWRHHYHPEFRLLDAGNYNEQGFDGSSELLLDLFTNTAMHSGLAALGRVAAAFGDENSAGEFAEQAGLLAAGIEQRLFDPERGFYRSGYSLDRRGFMPEENWIILYCRRWYEGRPEAWERAYAELLSDTAIRWDDHTLVTGETPGRRFMLLGKFFAQQLGYFAGTGREAELRDGLCFLEESVRRPFNLYPEWWFHHRPEKLSGYIRDFLADHRELWCAYAEDPAGDYTVDSGNCEQTAVFLQHMLDDILGVRFRHGRLQLRPALVHGGGCSALPVECGKALSFHYENNRLEVETGLCREFELGLPAAAGLPYIVTVNGIPAEARRESGQQLDTLFVTCPPAAGRIQITVHPEGDRV